MMKSFLLSVISLSIATLSYAQCTLTGLNSFYCSSDTVSVLTASCNGTPTIFGPGINSNGDFDPSLAGSGNVDIYVLDGNPSYTIDQVGSYDTIGVPSSATTVSLGDDDVASNLSIGFTFNFFASQYTTFGISSNGFLFFGSNTDDGCCSGDFMPSGSTPNNVIAFAWEDLDPNSGIDGTISYWTQGVAPNRVCVVDFDSVPHYPGTGFYVTSQIKLYEGCGLIEIHTTSMPSDGGSHTMGIENSTGSAAFPVSGRNSSSWTIANDYVGFIPDCGDTFSTYVSDGPDITFAMDSLMCFGDTDGEITATAVGSAPLSYLWSTSDTSATITGLGIGTYTVTVTDSAGCFAEDDISMYSPPALAASFDIVEALCESSMDGSATINPTGGTPPYSYAWSSGGTGLAITGVTAGGYVVTLTDSLDCDIALNTSIGFANEDPDINLGDDVKICPGQSTVLVATPGYDSYAWSDSSTTNSIIVSSAGTYSVTATSAAGCTGSDEVMVQLNIPDQVDLGPSKSGFGPILLDAGPQYVSYFWNTGATTQTLNVAVSGDYSVAVQDTNGCLTADTVKVKIWPSGIDESILETTEVFPNPTTDIVYLKLSDNTFEGALKVYDANGALVVDRAIVGSNSDRIEVDLSAFAGGQYMFSLEDGDRVGRWMIIKH